VPYDSKAIANYFLKVADHEGKELTPLKLIKLVYIAHGWHLGITGEPLINEHPEAWEYGPVIPSVYHEFKIFGNGPIRKRATEIVSKTEGSGWALIEQEVIPPTRKSDAAICNFLDRVWQEYGSHTGSQLSSLTHQANTPWKQTWERRGKYERGVDIPEDAIQQHYRSLRERSVRIKRAFAP
jgi:uncharacterized phage-associated protein